MVEKFARIEVIGAVAKHGRGAQIVTQSRAKKRAKCCSQYMTHEPSSRVKQRAQNHVQKNRAEREDARGQEGCKKRPMTARRAQAGNNMQPRVHESCLAEPSHA